jgi:hypothetical protein
MSRRDGSNVIGSEDLERAERLLGQSYRLTEGIRGNPIAGVADRARINPLAMEVYLSHHKNVLFHQYLPDIDPRHEPAIMTMLAHMLAVGATAQRCSEGKS